MYLSSTPRAELWPRTPKGATQVVAASAVVWAVAAALLYMLVPGLDSFPRLLVFSECVGLTMVACAVLLLRQRRLERLAAGNRWLLTGVIAIPTGYLLGHQIAFLLLGEPMRLGGHRFINLVPILFTVLVGGLGLRHFATREQLAREAAARAEAQRLAVEAQLRLLRTQLEPHMLFNTLANLRGLVREDADRAEAMIDRLIVYLRGTLASSETESVPLSREFAQLRAYLEIMSLRMGPRLTFRLELPAALEDTPVPPMLLQPLVENAIKHGLEPKVGPGPHRGDRARHRRGFRDARRRQRPGPARAGSGRHGPRCVRPPRALGLRTAARARATAGGLWPGRAPRPRAASPRRRALHRVPPA